MNMQYENQSSLKIAKIAGLQGTDQRFWFLNYRLK